MSSIRSNSVQISSPNTEYSKQQGSNQFSEYRVFEITAFRSVQSILNILSRVQIDLWNTEHSSFKSAMKMSHQTVHRLELCDSVLDSSCEGKLPLTECCSLIKLRNKIDSCFYYRLQTKFAKVMFLQLSLCPRGGGRACVAWGCACHAAPPPRADTMAMAYGEWAGGTHPTGMHSCFKQFIWHSESGYNIPLKSFHSHFRLTCLERELQLNLLPVHDHYIGHL